MVEDLLNQNEEHFIDLIENTDRFLQDLQEAGFQPGEYEVDERRKLPNSAQSHTHKYVQEIDGIIDKYAHSSEHKTLLSPKQPYRTFNSAKSKNRGKQNPEFVDTKEAALFDRINELQNEIHYKEEQTAEKYESIVSRLERKLKLEAQMHNDMRRKYKVLIQSASNFQSSLKDLQKAVRAKKYNISSYKKIFEERSKQLSNELLKYNNKIKTTSNLSNRKDYYNTFGSNFASKEVSPEKFDKSRPKSEIRVVPTNLSRVYYDAGKDEEIEKIKNKVQKLEKQVENSKLKLKEVNKERSVLQEL